MPRPMPRPEPVTTATLPSSSFPMRTSELVNVPMAGAARLTCAPRECQSNARSSRDRLATFDGARADLHVSLHAWVVQLGGCGVGAMDSDGVRSGQQRCQ